MLMTCFQRDIRLSFRHGGGALAGVSFYILTFILFAFALGPEALMQAAPGVLSVTLLLSSIISLPHLFERDMEDGTLEQYVIQSISLEWLMSVKITAYWTAHAAPLLIIAPFLASIAGVPADQLPIYAGRLFCASISIVAIGALGSALTLLRKNAVFARALILFPLYVPVLIFTVASITLAYPTLLLAAWACIMLPASCFICAWLVKVSQE